MTALRHVALIACAFVVLAGCATAADPKGTEDHPLSDGDGKADSFYHPTDHGVLRWEIPARAELTEDALFHAWTFTLSDTSSFSLQTDASGSLDTVMYLYHRDDGASEWGHYVAKNDDYQSDRATSRIELEDAPSGEYQVVVKGYKTNYRGAFTLTGSCSGDGCADPAMCDATSFPGLESGPGYSAACDAKLIDVLSSPVTSTTPQGVALEDRCHLGALELRAVELYQGYWDDVQGWDDFTGGDPVTLDVTTETHEAGTVVDVDWDGPDEDRIIAVFDEAGALLMLWNDGQSPDERWFCAAPGEPSEEYGPSCALELFAALPHEASDVTSASGTTTPDDAMSDVDDLLSPALSEFAAQYGLAGGASVRFDGATWTNHSGLHGGQVTFSASGHESTYTMMTTWDDHLLISAVESEGKTTMSCTELM